jgi:UDP-glucose 4-epimerase
VIVGVTGGAGFIAGHVTDRILAAGHDVLLLDHVKDRRDRDDRVGVMLGDVRDETAVFEFAAHVDGIIHLAAVLGTQETIDKPLPSAETNIVGSLHVFEAAARYRLPVVYAGVGNHAFRLHGAGAYTITKSAAEDFARMFNAYRGGNIAIVRPVNAYGPRQSVAAPFGPSKVRKIMPAFICRALTGQPIEVYGDGTQVSDCVYVEDVARAFVSALAVTLSLGRPELPVEVGPAHSCTVAEVAELVLAEAAKVTGRQQAALEYLPMRRGEIPGAVVSSDVSTLTQIDLAARNFVPLQEGIRRTVAWYAEHWLPGWDGARRG